MAGAGPSKGPSAPEEDKTTACSNVPELGSQEPEKFNRPKRQTVTASPAERGDSPAC